MRAGAARGHVGHFHEAGFYGSDAEFAALIVPFVEEGVAAGEPVIIGYDDRKAGLLRSWLADPSAVEFISDQGLYATPAGAIATYRRTFESHLARGAGQIRIAGDVPHPGNGRRFDGWDRYECAINTVWQDIPVTVRIWATPDRIVVSVHDTGPGPADPLAGLVPAAHSPSNPGLGLWVTHQLDVDTALIRTGDGFTVRLRTRPVPG
jgi:DcmR-like sensory protein/histidine kinase-like protein